MTDRWTDDQLVEELARGLDQVDPVPPEVSEFARAAFGWRSIDAELAELVFDSSQEELVGVRSDAASTRELTFRAPGVEIEVVMLSDGARRLIGQLVPQQKATVELRCRDEVTSTESDDLGRFSFSDVPAGPISLRCICADSTVQTDWIV